MPTKKIYDRTFVPNAQQNTPDERELALMIEFDEVMRGEAGDLDVQLAKLIEQCAEEAFVKAAFELYLERGYAAPEALKMAESLADSPTKHSPSSMSFRK